MSKNVNLVVYLKSNQDDLDKISTINHLTYMQINQTDFMQFMYNEKAFGFTVTVITCAAIQWHLPKITFNQI